MHPAASIIFFTVASGAGYGLLTLLGLLSLLDVLPAERWFGLAALGVAFGLITAGLLSSTFHLGHPERAWRALTQWRSSWLSREGVAALATYVPAGLFAIGWIFMESKTGIWRVSAGLAALGAVVTVACTGMIYASLKTIRQWHNRWVVPGYLALAVMTGAVALAALAGLFGIPHRSIDLITVVSLLVALAIKLAYWHDIDNATPRATPESATGLGGFGRVRLLDSPHTGPNYVMREMGYRVARKHAKRLRRLSLAAAFGLPLMMLLADQLIGIGAVAPIIAALLVGVGVAIERWLFFAEATHVSMTYYGRQG